MYEKVEKPKEKKSRAVANSVAQKKNNVKQGFGFVDNRPKAIAQRNLKETAHNSPQVSQLRAFQEMVNPSLQTESIQVEDNKMMPKMAQRNGAIQGMFASAARRALFHPATKTAVKGGGGLLGAGLASTFLPSDERSVPGAIQSGPSTPLTANVFDPAFHILGLPTARTHALAHKVSNAITDKNGEFDGRSIDVIGHSEGGMNSVLATSPRVLGEEILRKRGDKDLRLRDQLRLLDEFGDGGVFENRVDDKIATMPLNKQVKVTTMGSPYILGQSARQNITPYSADNDEITASQKMLGFPYLPDPLIHDKHHSFVDSYQDKMASLASTNPIFSGGMFTSHDETLKRVKEMNEGRKK